MEPFDTIVLSVTVIAVGGLLTGSVWGIMGAPSDRKDAFKSAVKSFVVFTLVTLVAAALYYTPSTWISQMATWLAVNPYWFRINVIPLYVLAIFLLIRIIRRNWS